MTSPPKGAVRRTIVLPAEILDDLRRSAPQDLRDNLSALVRLALRDFLARLRDRRFAEIMREMAADPDVRRECRTVGREFHGTDADGLRR